MDLKKSAIMLAALLLIGCQSTVSKKPPLNAPSDDATIKLAEAAHSVSNSLLELARIKSASTPKNLTKALPDTQAFNLQTRASVDWSGPIQPLAEKVAKAGHYRLRVLGKAPAVPVLIGVSTVDATLGDILRDMDFQAGNKASVKIYAHKKVIELRYAKA